MFYFSNVLGKRLEIACVRPTPRFPPRDYLGANDFSEREKTVATPGNVVSPHLLSPLTSLVIKINKFYCVKMWASELEGER